MEKHEYIDLKYQPSATNLVVKYRIVPNSISIEKACEHIAAESSIGTWTDVCTLSDSIKKKLKPHVFDIDKKHSTVKIAYIEDLFEAQNVPQILSSIAGNIFGMNAVKSLKLLDISFPKSIVRTNPGPRFGIKGIREITRIKDRPLVGTIIKPKVGLGPKDHAEVAYNAWIGGLDLVKDDENLTSLKFNSFDERIKLTLKARDRAEKITGERKFYMPNVTSEANEMLRRAGFVKSLCGEYAMVDIITAGFSALETLRQSDLGLIIHAHRAMHAALTRSDSHGISMLAIAKLSRLVGVDQLHIGAIVGKMHGSGKEVVAIENNITQSIIKENDSEDILSQDWQNLKPVLPVASGGLHPGLVPELVKYMGSDIVMQFGGGCHGHPGGTVAGAKAIRQAVHLLGAKNKTSLDNYPELRRALEVWGNR